MFQELLKSAEEIKAGNLITAEQLHAEMEEMFAEWEKEEKE